MRALNHPTESVYRFGEFQLDAVKRVLVKDGEIVPLTPKRFDILLLLVRNRDRVIDKDELMKEVWQQTFVEETNLTHNISVLRKALGEKAGEHRFIVTVPGQGYRFVAGVSESPVEGTLLIERSRTRLVIEEDDGARVGASYSNTDFPQAAVLLSEMGGEQIQNTKAPGVQVSTWRKPVLAVGSVAMIIAALIASAVYLSNSRRAASAQPFQNLNLTRITTANRATSAVISPDGEYLAYVLEDHQGQALWLRHLPTSSNACIVPAAGIKYWGITFSPDGDYVYYCTFTSARSGHNLYRIPILGGSPVLLPVETNTAITFSPDSKRFAYMLPSAEGSHLFTAAQDGSDKQVLATRRHPEFFLTYPGAPAWSPDGKFIACAYATPEEGVKCRLTAFRVEDGEEAPLPMKFWDYVGQAAWLTGGSRLIFVGSEAPGVPKQAWQLSLTDGALTRLTNDLNDYRGVSLTANSRSLVTVQQHTSSSLWMAPADNPDAAELLTSETGEISHVEFTSDGALLYSSTASGKFTLQSVSTETKEVKTLPVEGLLSLGFSVSGDNRCVVFPADRDGSISLWKYKFVSGEITRLTDSNMDNRPQCSSDGRWVIYEKGFGNSTRTFWKASIDGGEPVQVSRFHAIRPALSPDGKLIAFYFLDRSRTHSPWCIGVMSSDGGAVLKKFDIPKTVTSRFVTWTPDGRAVAYINDIGGVSNIWVQLLNGSAADLQPKPITKFASDRIVAFDWSPDGKYLAISRALESSYVALIRDDERR